MSSGIVTKEWVAVHRKHHARCETAGRSAQPGHLRSEESAAGRRRAVSGRRRAIPRRTEKFGRGTPDDWMEHNVYLRYRNFGIVLMVLRRPAAVRRAGHHHPRRADAGESAHGGRRHQRHRPLLRLSQLRVPGRGAQRHAVGLPRRRRRAAQQSSRVPELGEVLGAALGVRHRLAVHPHLPDVRPREGHPRRAGAGEGRAARAHRSGNGARGHRQSHARAARIHAQRDAAGVPRRAARRWRQAERPRQEAAGARARAARQSGQVAPARSARVEPGAARPCTNSASACA